MSVEIDWPTFWLGLFIFISITIYWDLYGFKATAKLLTVSLLTCLLLISLMVLSVFLYDGLKPCFGV